MSVRVVTESTRLIPTKENVYVNVSDDEENDIALKNLHQARSMLYASHCFAKITEMSWQFCLTMFLAAFTEYKSLLLVSSYGLLSGIVTCLTRYIYSTHLKSNIYISYQFFHIYVKFS